MRRLLFLLPLLWLAACGNREPELPEGLSLPDWYGSVEAPTFETEQQLSELWRAKPRCCVDKAELQANQREFDQACYQSIVAHPNNAPVVAKCLWLMGASETPERKLMLKRYLVSRHGDYDARTDNCFNCAPGDLVLRSAGELAWLEARAGNETEGLRVLETTLDRRETDASPWVQAEALTRYGRLVLEAGVTPRLRQEFQHHYDRLAAARAGDEALQRHWKDLEAVRLRLLAAG